MFAVFGLGVQEIIVILAIGFVLVALPLAIVLAVVLSQRKGPKGPQGPAPG